MKCPQCMRENQFPVPGLCPECYKIWKDDMRARYGPGPWPALLTAQKANGDALAACGEAADDDRSASGAFERSVTAVLERLSGPDRHNRDLLHQVNAVLREVAIILAQSAAHKDEYMTNKRSESMLTHVR